MTLAEAEKVVREANLFYPRLSDTAAARKVAAESQEATLKARAGRLRELIRAAGTMGDYGEVMMGGTGPPVFARVIALGAGRHQMELLASLEQRGGTMAELKANAAGDVWGASGTVAAGPFKGRDYSASLSGQGLVVSIGGDHRVSRVLKRETRRPPTLNQKPPTGAVVLFDGKGFGQWRRARGKGPVRWRLVEGGAMEVVRRGGSMISKKEFGDCTLHLEFRTPFMPEARGQKRGNSGLYVQGRYEVQILDSYGLAGRKNECGAIYGVAGPKVNACAPPTVWQTYDIDFRAPRVKDGKVVEPARMTVLHNGIRVHDNQPVSRQTTAAPGGPPKPTGGLYLQDHGDPVQFRNIWVVEKKDL